jgi:hypothetical protein
VALFDVAAGNVRIAGQIVDVQFDGGRTGILHRSGVSGPTARRAPIDAADHGNRDRGGRAFEQAQVPARAVVVAGRRREV